MAPKDEPPSDDDDDVDYNVFYRCLNINLFKFNIFLI
jgi:hypothetical protein